jgi:putative endonuclease
LADYYVYIMASVSRVIYIGVTNNLERRTVQHRQYDPSHFTSQHHVHRLVYFESFTDPREAIGREKQLKNWRREKKAALIEALNSEWRELSTDWFT